MSRTRLWQCPARSILALAALLLMSSVVPVAASVYEVDLHPYDGGNLICAPAAFFQAEPFPVSGSHTQQAADVVGFSTGTQEALAGLGYVGMKNDFSHQVNPGFGRIFGSCSTVRTVIDDLQVTGPPGQVTASLQADLLAKIVVDTLASRSHLRVRVSFRSTQGGPTASNTVEIDLSESMEIDMVVDSGPLTFDVGDVLEAELEIDMRLVAGPTRGTAPVVNVFDFLDEDEGYGLHFSKTAVLTLPAGYTANSANGDVGGNQWGGTVPVTGSTWGSVKSLYR